MSFPAMSSFLFEREVFVNGISPVTLSTAQAMFPTIDADLIRHLDSAEHGAWCSKQSLARMKQKGTSLWQKFESNSKVQS